MLTSEQAIRQAIRLADRPARQTPKNSSTCEWCGETVCTCDRPKDSGPRLTQGLTDLVGLN